MIVLDMVAPILLMFGLLDSASFNASLLNNFEIVCTSIIALMLFKETISKRMWLAISLITTSSFVLSFNDIFAFKFSWGAILVLLATLCLGEHFAMLGHFGLALLLGFVAYGLSIFFYIKAQNIIGASKTSAYYAIAPFIGTFLSFVIFKEKPTLVYFVGLTIMILGTVIVVVDTLAKKHNHIHKHTVTHTHDGSTHTHMLEHKHEHIHYLSDKKHHHFHKVMEPR